VNTFLQATAVFLPILYLLAATLYGMHFGGPEAAPAAPARRLRKAVLALALVLHLLRFAVAWQVRGGLPVNDPWSTLSLTALVTALLYGCIASWVNHAGTGGVVLGGWWAAALSTAGWLHVKLTRVLALIAYHLWMWRTVRVFAADSNRRSDRFYRMINEIPALLLVAIVIMVVVTVGSAVCGALGTLRGLTLYWYMST
jgi:hypothetical protein